MISPELMVKESESLASIQKTLSVKQAGVKAEKLGVVVGARVVEEVVEEVVDELVVGARVVEDVVDELVVGS